MFADCSFLQHHLRLLVCLTVAVGIDALTAKTTDVDAEEREDGRKEREERRRATAQPRNASR